MSKHGVTPRSVLFGALCAFIMNPINSFLTLKIGLIEEAVVLSIIFFVIGFGVKLAPETLRKEAVVVGTIGSAGATLAFMTNMFAALSMTGYDFVWWKATLFIMSVCSIGLVFAISMRQLYVVKEPLPWPTGKVVISAMDALIGSKDIYQARTLIFFSVLFFLYIFFSAGIPWFPEVSLFGFGLGAYLVGFAWAPFVFGAGYLIGLRVGFGFLIGGIILALMGPYMPYELKDANGVVIEFFSYNAANIPEGAKQAYPHAYIWPGVLALVTSSFMALILKGRSVINAFKSVSLKRVGDDDDLDRVVSNKTLSLLMVISFIFSTCVLHFAFDVAIGPAFIGLVVGGLLFNLVAVRAYGESAFNPVRIMGILLIAVFVGLGVEDITISLLAAGIASGAILQTGILVSDSYFGRHYGIPAKVQIVLQGLILIPVAFLSGFVFKFLNANYEIGGEELPAPIAQAWKTMAEVLGGQANFPPFAIEAMWIGGIAGILLTLMDHVANKKIAASAAKKAAYLEDKPPHTVVPGHWFQTGWRFWPNSLGITLGLILPIYYDFTFFLGAVVLVWLIPKVFRFKDSIMGSIAAAGIVGEGIGQLVVGILKAVGLLGGGGGH